MTRSLFNTLMALAIIGLAYWAYNENYATQDAMRRVEELQQKIGQNREELSVLRAEWAYLNRPERLRELADLNFDSLRLMPLAPEHFGDVEQVAFPVAKSDPEIGDITESTDLSATFDGHDAGVRP
ncbi:MAG: cell division protein FtsL [Rhodobacteraceae bacterium]|nr:cell division protein FtsL [Paracoccaceae bacterium]